MEIRLASELSKFFKPVIKGAYRGDFILVMLDGKLVWYQVHFLIGSHLSSHMYYCTTKRYKNITITQDHIIAIIDRKFSFMKELL